MHRLSIAIFAKFYLPGNPEIGQTVAVGENQCQIKIQRPKITLRPNFRQHNYPKKIMEMPTT